ncbi:hypothetical protein ACROYT_G015507 [Oculina patagonica]
MVFHLKIVLLDDDGKFHIDVSDAQKKYIVNGNHAGNLVAVIPSPSLSHSPIGMPYSPIGHNGNQPGNAFLESLCENFRTNGMSVPSRISAKRFSTTREVREGNERGANSARDSGFSYTIWKKVGSLRSERKKCRAVIALPVWNPKDAVGTSDLIKVLLAAYNLSVSTKVLLQELAPHSTCITYRHKKQKACDSYISKKVTEKHASYCYCGLQKSNADEDECLICMHEQHDELGEGSHYERANFPCFKEIV